ncbi:farnesol dehydrogenase-like [Trichogramma pretiosum]|uniref:farnesol dehydrogenase-like n=1 Tax=Trichogramma pretiosum TaxID=7493 RepID=UPI0006C99CF5|nr:farnesol dehydrogenase-like [Trichogramma pretiosum]
MSFARQNPLFLGNKRAVHFGQSPRGLARWRGKTAMVTGVAGGIGEAIAYRLLKAGINVIGLDLNVAEQTPAAKEHNKTKGPDGMFMPLECDITIDEHIRKMFDVAENWLNGGVQILVNNAGVNDYTRIIDSNCQTFEKLLKVNVLAAANATQRTVQMLRDREEEGHIFNINSILGLVVPESGLLEEIGVNGLNIYPATKHALSAMSTTVRREVSLANLPIRVTSLHPGLVNTKIAARNEAVNKHLKHVPQLDPSDVADALMYALGTSPEVQISEMSIRRTGEIV